jgi:hypothetical protein
MRDSINNVRTSIKNYKGYVYIPDLREFMEIGLEKAKIIHHNPLSMIPESKQQSKK